MLHPGGMAIDYVFKGIVLAPAKKQQYIILCYSTSFCVLVKARYEQVNSVERACRRVLQQAHECMFFA